MTQLITAENPQTAAKLELQSLIASCAEFQSACGVYSETDALPFVYREVFYPAEQQVRKPFAVLWTPAGGGYTPQRLADDTVLESGNLMLRIGMPLVDPENVAGLAADFDNLHGSIVEWLHAYRDWGYRWLCQQTIGPQFTAETEQNDLGLAVAFWDVEYLCAWGPL